MKKTSNPFEGVKVPLKVQIWTLKRLPVLLCATLMEAHTFLEELNLSLKGKGTLQRLAHLEEEQKKLNGRVSSNAREIKRIKSKGQPDLEKYA